MSYWAESAPGGSGACSRFAPAADGRCLSGPTPPTRRRDRQPGLDRGGARRCEPVDRNAAAKGAVNSLTVGLAREWAAEGIRVNAIMPGLIETEIHAEAGLGDRLKQLAPTVPVGRTGTAEE